MSSLIALLKARKAQASSIYFYNIGSGHAARYRNLNVFLVISFDTDGLGNKNRMLPTSYDLQHLVDENKFYRVSRVSGTDVENVTNTEFIRELLVMWSGYNMLWRTNMKIELKLTDI